VSDEPIAPPTPTPTPTPNESAPADDDGDAELRAAKALHAKIQRTRRKASLVSLIAGLLVGFVLAAAGEGFFAAQLGERMGVLAVVVVFFAPLLLALKLAALVADASVKRAVSAWIAALAKEHGVSESTLEDHARIAGAKDPV
jgi:hypothetical protein